MDSIKYEVSTFYWCFQSNPIWCLEKNDWKCSSESLSSFALIIMSLLSLFECITLWLLEDIKLIAIVNWIFHASDFSLRIFTISCKRGLKLHPGILQVIVFSFYHHFFRICIIVVSVLNVSTTHLIMSSKKLNYTWQKLLHNWHSCPTWN